MMVSLTLESVFEKDMYSILMKVQGYCVIKPIQRKGTKSIWT